MNSIFEFGPASTERRDTLHPKLKALVDLALEITEEDFSIICGWRGDAEQEAAYYSGKSKAKFGESQHNFYPSLAVDLAPYPIDWEDTARFEQLAKVIFQAADSIGIKVKWGGDWSFIDLPHFELVI